MFNLLRYFSLASAVALAAITVVLVHIARQSELNQLVESAESQNVTLARSFANVLWPRFSHYVASVSGMDGDALRARPETRELDTALKTLTNGLPVLKVKIYDLNGLTVYSSQPSQIGTDKSNNLAFMQSARDGKPASILSYRDTFSTFSGTVENRDLVESYLPIWAGDGAIEGVFELYTDVTPLMARVERHTIELIAGLLLSFGLLYGVLILIVRRADRILGQQYSKLMCSEETIRSKNLELLAAQGELVHQTRMATLGQLTATVTHELRNPLGVIQTSNSIVRNNLKDCDPRVGRSLERIERSVIRCDRIIDEILDYTHIRQLDLEQTPFDTWLEGVLEEQTLPTDITLRRNLNLPGVKVFLDQDRFRRAVINVFDNACHAMVGDGDSKIEEGEYILTIQTGKMNGRIEVVIEDNGPGIPPDVLPKIFEPMFSTKGFGVGLGLPVVKQIMEQHGGGIEIDSGPGRGTRTSLWLPSDHVVH